MKRLVWAFGLAVVAAHPAFAAMEPKYYVARRVAADHHLQVETKAVEAPAGGPCRVEGTAVRVFRSKDGRIAPGAAVSFTQACQPGSAWPAERLKAARVLEVFLRPSGAAFETADEGDGLRALDQPTDRPAVQDDPAVVRQAAESMAVYEIEIHTKRGEYAEAAALARGHQDPLLRARLLGFLAGSLATKKRPDAEGIATEALAALDAVADPDQRIETGLAVGESLVLGGADKAAAGAADRVAGVVERITLPSRRDEVLMKLFGIRVRAGDLNAAMASIARVVDPRERRERLETCPYAQKGFGSGNPDSPAFLDRLMAAAEAHPDPAFRAEALAALAKTAYAGVANMVQMEGQAANAAQLAEVAARRRHAPSALMLALLYEAGQGVAKSRAQAARWYAVAASGFGIDDEARAKLRRQLDTFTAAERAEAARLHLGPGAPIGKVSSDRLLDLIGR